MLRSKLMLIPALLIALAPAAHAQQGPRASNERADVPFGVGELMTYRVRLGPANVGTGSMEVESIDTIRGHETYAMRFRLQGGILFAKVDDDFRSWVDTQSLFSHRFKQDQKEVRYERHRTIDFFPQEGEWRTTDGKDSGKLASERPLDDVSFIYFVRTLPLEVGKTYTFNRYFKEDGNPVTIKVLRRETITVQGNTWRTIVVQPVIKTKGLFSEGGRAELYFSDDDRRVLVLLKSRVKLIGSLEMHLQSYTPGRKLES